MADYYLAVDIGASSGRHILACIQNGKICMEEVHRFENGMKKKNGKLLWDTKKLFEEIVAGMKKCGELGKIPVSMSIDTWGVDYVILDENDEILGETIGYRDNRTNGMDQEVYKIISEWELYKRTGIQKQMFNSIFQLMAVKKQTPELLEKANTFLMLPDYFQFLLTGVKVSEYTNGTTAQLVDPSTRQWDTELIEMLGFPVDMFVPLKAPGEEVGNLKEEIQNEVGFDCKVILCPSHDTASAIMAMPCYEKDGLYISSGTWSLMGNELDEAICNEKSMTENFTNEGGYAYKLCYLKNIMGLWMIQSVRHELDDKYSFAQLCEMGEECIDFPSRVNVNDDVFMAPENMTQAIKDYCANTDQKVPESIGEIATVIYSSLAECYGQTIREIEENCGKEYEEIYVIGGGSKAGYLNQLTADATGKKVCAGPGEATAIGNILAQMMKDKQWENLQQARKCVFDSFDVKVYMPRA